MASGLVILFGALLILALAVASRGLRRRYRSSQWAKADGEQLVIMIDAILPQTQCRRCGYSGCKPYAYAIVAGEAEINQCPPGGDKGIRQLAALLGRQYQPLNPKHGVEKPREVAFIDENRCIGCTLCLLACPVDAVVGAAKQMHTIVADLCTGCELCVPPCPMDCISMLPVASPKTRWQWKSPLLAILDISTHDGRADAARERYEFRQFREQRERQEKANRFITKPSAQHGGSAGEREPEPPPAGLAAADEQRKALIAAAVARAQLQKSQVNPANTTQLTAEQLAKIAEIEARRN